jgi:hypothetical protein
VAGARRTAGGQRPFDLLARAAAGVGRAAIGQRLQRRGICRATARLPQRRLVGVQAALCQLLQDDAVGARDAAWGVDILDAHQPAPARRVGVEPAGECRHQGAGVQRASG